MTVVIALPSGHDHLAAALVRDLGFTRVHVDEPIRKQLLAIDPLVEAGITLANIGRSPRLSSRLEDHRGDWGRLQERVPEVTRLVEALGEQIELVDKGFPAGDLVVTDIRTVRQWYATPKDATKVVSIEGREGIPTYTSDHVIPEGSIVDQEQAIVRYVRGLKTPAPADPFEASDDLLIRAGKATYDAMKGDTEVPFKGLKELVGDAGTPIPEGTAALTTEQLESAVAPLEDASETAST